MRRRQQQQLLPAAGYPLAALGVVLLVASSPVLLPCLLWKTLVDEKKRQIRAGERRSCPPPRGIYKSKRRQALGLLKHKTKTPASPIPQIDCPLLNLPLEIREIIWKECIGDGSVHLSKEQRSF